MIMHKSYIHKYAKEMFYLHIARICEFDVAVFW